MRLACIHVVGEGNERRRRTGPLLFETLQDGRGSAKDALRKAGKLGNVDPVAPIGLAGNDGVQKSNPPSLFRDRDGHIFNS